ncbi:hypothetical protein JOC77_002607 [Peribacillus deserti]|uniref:DUF3907 domain-containing protein n=1 Tax=Peribacillus deserti TaxID=673318 RepID=A0ABS2QJ28_9BACI|nr:DUF3907 family protein [Peribacillus deserti]MBM7693167.1 hypothetical protein [Peribacillus deserti]
MANTIIQNQMEDVKRFLESTVHHIEDFLNSVTLRTLQAEKSGDEFYYKSLLSNIRKLAVYSEENLEACKIVLNNDVFHKVAAEKILYKVYHQVIEEFFSPKTDSWYEDSRSAYTGRNSIKLRGEAPGSITALMKTLESGFQSVREELEFYETDYRTKMIQSN